MLSRTKQAEPNFYSILFMGLLLIPVLWWSGIAIQALYPYLKMSAQTPLDTLVSSVKEAQEGWRGDRFYVQSNYTYRVAGKNYQGTAVWSSEPFMNPWAAKQRFAETEKTRRIVWYAPKSPEWSTLDHTFPYKKTVYAITLWFLYGYFVYIGFFVGRKY